MSALKCIFQKQWFPTRALIHSWRCFSTSLISFSSQPSADSLTSITESDLGRVVSSCVKEGNFRLGSCLHAYIIKSPPFFDSGNPFRNGNAHVIYNSLLHMYCKSGELYDAVKLFDDMPLRDTVSWNSLISGFFRVGNLETGFRYFKSLLGCNSYQFDHASLTSVLSACGGIESLETLKMIHALAILNGYEKEITVGNALTTSYFRCKSFDSGMRVFDEMVERNVVTWTAAISGLAQNEFYGGSLKLFVEMHQRSSRVSPNCLTYLSALTACSGLQALKEGAQIHGIVCKLGMHSDLCIETALMDMYSKCGCVDNAWKIFDSAKALDEVSVTVILAGFAQNGFEEEAIRMFVKTVKGGARLDPNMISAILGVDSPQALGTQIHSMVIKKAFASNVYVNNGLMNMYSKCGELEESIKVFNLMPQKNQVSWNSMIAAFARHGDGLKALQLYEEMKRQSVEPTDVTFLSLLHACSHVGLLEKGMEFLETMERTYGMRPRMEHYACIVDMLGRAGLLKEAKEYIEAFQVKPGVLVVKPGVLVVKPGVLVWQALLGACSIYGDIDVGKYAADELARADPDSPVPFISMANIYSSRGRWKERATTIKEMKEKGVVKEMGVSWIEIEKKIHSFVVADQMHPQGEDVNAVLLMLFGHMRDEGRARDIKFVYLF